MYFVRGAKTNKQKKPNKIVPNNRRSFADIHTDNAAKWHILLYIERAVMSTTTSLFLLFSLHADVARKWHVLLLMMAVMVVVLHVLMLVLEVLLVT